MKALVFAFLAVGLAACTTLTAERCRSSNWYELGFRDGLAGIQQQGDQYDYQCRTHSASIDRARYVEGWQHGLWELDRRRLHGGSD